MSWAVREVSSSATDPHIDTYLNYPVAQSLKTSANGTMREVHLSEAVLEEDETTGWPNRVPTFHGYSASGQAEAEYVYVGRGQQADFERLVELGVELEGKIALARYVVMEAFQYVTALTSATGMVDLSGASK